MEWLGHSQVSQTMRYTHVLPEVARDTSSRMGQAMFGDAEGNLRTRVDVRGQILITCEM